MNARIVQKKVGHIVKAYVLCIRINYKTNSTFQIYKNTM